MTTANLKQKFFVSCLVVMATLIVPPVVLAETTADDAYAVCGGLNDFLSYSKCVAEIDSKKNNPVQPLTDDIKSKDGVFSLQINDGGLYVSERDVTLRLTASPAAVKIAIASDSNFGFAERQDFAVRKLWRLEETEDEPQYVYVKFFDAAGEALKVLSAAVILTSRSGNAAAETSARAEFKKIYGRAANANNSFDAETIRIMAYGVAKAQLRNLNKEQEAIGKFKAVYKRLPAKETDWRLVNAIAYGGASKEGGEDNQAAVVSSAAVAEQSAAVCTTKIEFKNILDSGVKGETVKELQRLLQCWGYLTADDKLTGVFDQTTEAAVKKFQAKQGLACKDGSYCGRVGPATNKRINELTVAAKNQPTPPPAAVATVVAAAQAIFKRNLTVGIEGDDVTKLQKFLAKEAELYPSGKVTGYFGPLTEQAVKKFQAKHGLTCKDGGYCGYIGPATLKKLNELYME